MEDLESQDPGAVIEDPIVAQLLVGVATGGAGSAAILRELATKELAAGGIADLEAYLASLTGVAK